MSSAGGSISYAGLHVGADWSVRCSTYDSHAPILTVDAGPASVALTLAGRAVAGERDVKFARELAAKAAVFAAECERLHAASQASSAGDAAVKAA